MTWSSSPWPFLILSWTFLNFYIEESKSLSWSSSSDFFNYSFKALWLLRCLWCLLNSCCSYLSNSFSNIFLSFSSIISWLISWSILSLLSFYLWRTYYRIYYSIWSDSFWVSKSSRLSKAFFPRLLRCLSFFIIGEELFLISSISDIGPVLLGSLVFLKIY